jgi:FkbM family methyltransferase
MSIRSYAQNFEDVMLWRALHNIESGFFIDIGAQHPIKDSVSKAFSEQGWRGIHVEPVPAYAELLRADRPNDTIVQAIISDRIGISQFYSINGTGLSTARQEIAEKHALLDFPIQPIAVVAITLDDLLDLAPQDDIHWLKVDVEGMEKAVLSGWKHSMRRPWIVVIEATQPGSQTSSFAEWQQLILDKGYRNVYSDGLNRFYLSDKYLELEPRFTFPPNIFDGFQLVEQSDYAVELVRAHQQVVTSLADRCAALRSTIDQTREQHEALERQLRDDAEQMVAEARDKAQARLDKAVEHERDNSLKLHQQASDFRDTIDRMREETVAREHHICAEADKTLQREITRSETLNADLAMLTTRLQHAEMAFNVATRSRSWRLAAPLRVIFGERALPSRANVAEAGMPIPRINQSSSPIYDNSNEKKVRLNGIIDPLKATATVYPRDSAATVQKRDSDSMASDVIYSILDLLALPISNFVQTSYEMLLGRLPDPLELKERASVLRAGWGRRRLLAEITQSPEFKVRQDRLLHEGDDETFVKQQYRRYLNRVPDSDGLATYLGFLNNGKSRAQIRNKIATSREARIAGTFWFELDLLVADENKDGQRFGRSFGKLKRLNRLRNQELEITHYGRPQYNGPLREPQMSSDGATTIPLAKVDEAGLGRNARRALSRLRHFAGIASQSEGQF